MKQTNKLITMSLMAALTCVATMVIKIQTPTFGYIHMGDGLVLLCGIILGPIFGGIAAGIGSMLADFLSGYIIWAPATLLIKGVVAYVAGNLFYKKAFVDLIKTTYIRMIITGFISELLMMTGYYVYEIGITMLLNGKISETGLLAGISAATASIPFNGVQGVTGVIICTLIYPFMKKALKVLPIQ